MIERYVREVLVGRYGLSDAQHLSLLRTLLERGAGGRLPPNYRQHREAYAELLARDLAGLDPSEQSQWFFRRMAEAAPPDSRPACLSNAIGDLLQTDGPRPRLEDLYCRVLSRCGSSPPGG